MELASLIMQEKGHAMSTSADNALVLFCTSIDDSGYLNTFEFCSLYILDMSVGIHCENFVLCCKVVKL